jgi:hypothetical protein
MGKRILLRTHTPAFLLICSMAILAFGAWAAAGTKSSGVFQQDKGKFAILLDGNQVGHEDFEIAPSGTGWIARGTTQMKPPQGPSTKVTGKLTLQPDGSPVAYEWSSQADKTNGAQIAFSNGVAKIILQMQGARPFEQDLNFGTRLVAVLDNNLYDQYAVLARIYDWSKRGVQTFPVLIPQELTPGSITVEANGDVTAGGKSYEGLKVTTSDLEVQLYLDSDHRLMRLEVPSAKVSIVRE